MSTATENIANRAKDLDEIGLLRAMLGICNG